MRPRNRWGKESPSAGGRAYLPWTTRELAYLRRHRADGADAIASTLGRSQKSVRRMAERAGVSLRVRPGELCPRCGLNRVREGTVAARHGVCVACWTRHLAELREERRDEDRAETAYEHAKKGAQRGGGRDA